MRAVPASRTDLHRALGEWDDDAGDVAGEATVPPCAVPRRCPRGVQLPLRTLLPPPLPPPDMLLPVSRIDTAAELTTAALALVCVPLVARTSDGSPRVLLARWRDNVRAPASIHPTAHVASPHRAPTVIVTHDHVMCGR